MELLYLWCKEGWQKSMLTDYHTQKQALSRFFVGAMLLTDPVLDVIRRELRRVSPDVRIDTDQISAVLATEVIKREVLEGEKADEARKKITRAAAKALRTIAVKPTKSTPDASAPGLGVWTEPARGATRPEFVHDGVPDSRERTVIINDGAPLGSAAPAPAAAAAAVGNAAIKVVSGAASGREVPLIKVVTTIGKPGVAVAAITRRAHGYVLTLVEGSAKPIINGQPIGAEAVLLRHGDLIEFAGTQIQFVQQ